jgi:hypothetical protein
LAELVLSLLQFLLVLLDLFKGFIQFFMVFCCRGFLLIGF